MGLLKEDIPATISALDDFIQNLFLGISPQASKENLEAGLVTITSETNPRYYGNALLITDNGYFLTVAHCLKNIPESLRDNPTHISYDGNLYPIQRVCASHRHADIALAKADLKAEPCARRYLLYPTYEVRKRTPVTLLTRKQGEIETIEGLAGGMQMVLYQDKGGMFDHFQLLFTCVPGDSGGSIIDSSGRLMGFLSCGDRESSDAAYILDGLQLIHTYKERLRKRLPK